MNEIPRNYLAWNYELRAQFLLIYLYLVFLSINMLKWNLLSELSRKTLVL